MCRFFSTKTYAVFLLWAGAGFALAGAAHADNTEKVIGNFRNPGGYSASPLISDAAGNLFGAAEGSAVSPPCPPSCGEVFELIRGAEGRFKYRVLYVFQGDGDGANPEGHLTFDAAGNLYGTTRGGGTGSCSGALCGTVFELSPTVSGYWKETVLYSFSNASGYLPTSGVIFDSAGNLFGTALAGGSPPDPLLVGVVFQLTPSGTGWTESIIHTFTDAPDGAYPWGLKPDGDGNFWGVTDYGGNATACSFGCGTVYEITPTTFGGWNYSLIYNFQGGLDGIAPVGDLIFDVAGNIYGTTSQGGRSPCATYTCGTVFELTKSSAGSWTEQVLYHFQGAPDASYPLSGLVLNETGNLYGTTYYGGVGACGGCGTVFELSPSSGGGWTETILHSFDPTAFDGAHPFAALIFGPEGRLYGTTLQGGLKGVGVIFGIKP